MLKVTALFVFVLVAATGCGGGNSPTDSADPANSPRATVSESRDDKLPTDFPKGFPLPQDSKVLVSGDLTGNVKLVLFEAETPSGGLRKFFLNGLPEEDWALANCTESPAKSGADPVSVIVATKGKLQANVTAGYLDVDYPIEYDGPYSFAVQYWETEAAFATPKAVPEACTKPPGKVAKPSPPADNEKQSETATDTQQQQPN